MSEWFNCWEIYEWKHVLFGLNWLKCVSNNGMMSLVTRHCRRRCRYPERASHLAHIGILHFANWKHPNVPIQFRIRHQLNTKEFSADKLSIFLFRYVRCRVNMCAVKCLNGVSYVHINSKLPANCAAQCIDIFNLKWKKKYEICESSIDQLYCAVVSSDGFKPRITGLQSVLNFSFLVFHLSTNEIITRFYSMQSTCLIAFF